jgi:hypothetical protein
LIHDPCGIPITATNEAKHVITVAVYECQIKPAAPVSIFAEDGTGDESMVIELT